MTEITRVPLLPIAKGSIGKLWTGVVLTAAAGAALAFAAMPPLVTVKTVKPGEGAAPLLSDVAIINYKGTLKDGTVFDSAQGAALPLQGVIPGFTKALLQMKTGGSYKIHIPARMAYGDKAQGIIPANSDLDFDIDLLQVMPMEEYQRQMMMMRQMQMQQMQGAAHGAPHGGAEAPAMPQ